MRRRRRRRQQRASIDGRRDEQRRAGRHRNHRAGIPVTAGARQHADAGPRRRHAGTRAERDDAAGKRRHVSQLYGAAEAQNSNVVFSCGCTAQAGASLLQAGGVFSIPQTAPATPSAPQPTYTTVPGRNYLIVATNQGNSESWALEFLGTTPSHNLALGPNATSDVFTAAGSLYVYFFSGVNSDTAFDTWNFNSVLAWVNHLRLRWSKRCRAATAQRHRRSPGRRPDTLSDGADVEPWRLTNSAIAADLNNVQTSGDAALPTPCPGGACTATPSP